VTRMHCSHAKTDIALLVGGDLDHEAVPPLKAHLENCPECASHFRAMRSNLAVLQAVQDVPFEHGESLWPRLMPALSYAEQRQRVKQFNGWVASVAVAAICLAMVTLAAEFRNDNVSAPYAMEPGETYHRVAQPERLAHPAVPVQVGVPVRHAFDWPGQSRTSKSPSRSSRSSSSRDAVLLPF